ncbi:MAG: hypothetical protein KZQ78_17280 [Candidatus Thiodiazotropha sp. (ex Ustalcina ferruginea)]|nr:hypothetical protein [Candidatus Thiodiazotropha sp. (ex Ustalcina ferruginea)]
MFHDEREDLQTADTERSNRAIVSGFIHRGKHKLNASFLANDRTRSLFMDEQLDWQADVTHVYTQSPRFSLATSAGANGSESNNDVDNVKTTQGRVGTVFHWRSENMPLSLRGDFLMKSLKSEAEVNEERTEDEIRGSISVIYLPTDHWRLRIGAGGKSRTGSVREKSYFETISANYNSKLIPLGEFFYSYGTGLDLSNETNSRTDDEQIYRANISHNLNRNWMSDWNGPLGSSMTIGQDISYEQSDIQDNIGTLVHRLTYSINATNEMRTTNLGITLYDSRNTGRNDLISQNLNLNAIHNHRISRYSGFGLTYNINYTRQSGRASFIDDEDDPFTDRVETEIENGKYTSLEIFYHNNRLLKVRNLRFKSRLRTSTDSLLLDHLNSTPSSEILWENRIDYTIGKLDVDFRTTWIERPAFEEGGTKTILLNIRRLF